MIFNDAHRTSYLRLIFVDKNTTRVDGKIGSQLSLRMPLPGFPKQDSINSQYDCERRYSRCADAIDYVSGRKFAPVGIGILILLVLPVAGLLLVYRGFYWTGIGLTGSWGLIVIGSLAFLLALCSIAKETRT